jgi:hypothetical protein
MGVATPVPSGPSGDDSVKVLRPGPGGSSETSTFNNFQSGFAEDGMDDEQLLSDVAISACDKGGGKDGKNVKI